MGKDREVIDIRSTGRRRARRTLFKAYIEFKCVRCGKTTKEPPKDAPPWFDEIWPTENRVLSSVALQADHETKDLTVNDVEDLNWKCASCHKLDDLKTEKGVSQKHNDILKLL